jgi:hypothetical protein
MTWTIVIAVLSAVALIDGPPTVSGRVVADETGNPIVSARVRILETGHPGPFVVTDSEGRFTVPLTSTSNAIAVAVVKSGYIRREALVRVAQAPIEIRLARAAVISGRVIDRLGNPIADGRVTAVVQGQMKGAPANAALTSTDEAGEFRLAGLAAGSFVVSVTTVSVSGAREVDAYSFHYDSQLSKTYYPQSDTADDAEAIVLTAGEEHPNVDIVVPANQVGGVPFGFAGPVRRTAKPTSPDASGTIAGHVMTPDGSPVSHAVVRLLGAFAPAPDQGTTSDGDGRYSFTGLGAGTYRIAATKVGYAPLKSSDIVLSALPMLGAGPSITLSDDQKRENVDVVLARLGSVSGSVFDELGDPVQGATIQLLRVRFERGRRRLVPTGTSRSTDDRGRYKIFDLSPGQYLVAASAGATMNFGGDSVDLPGYATTYFPGSPDPRAAQFVAVTISQEVTGIDFSLTATRTAVVSGTIVNAAGAPTRGGTLQLKPVSGSSATPVPMDARTPEDGVFEFANVAPGTYVIYADRGRQNPSIEGEFASMPVTVAGDDVTGLSVQMSSGSTIAGRITFDTVDPDHRPDASRIEISPVPTDSDSSPGTPAHANIARDWTFEMRGINGLRRLLAPQLPPGWALREVRVNGVDATDRPIAFGRREQSLSDVEVVLTDRVAVIAGAVTDADQRPTAGALVLAFPDDRDQRYPWSRFVQHSTSAANGTFSLGSVPAGSYYVAAVGALPIEGDDAWQDAAFQESLVPTALTVTVSDGETRTTALRLTGDRP